MKERDASVLKACISALNNGQIIVVPTTRWYMFAARADVPTTAPAIFRLKRRSPDKSLLLIAPSCEWATLKFEFSADAEKLANAFWPGDLSLRLRWRPATDGYPAVGNPIGLVAVAPGLLGDLAAKLGRALVTTSVNFSGTPAEGGTQPRFAFEHVVDMLNSNADAACVAIAVNGGTCPQVDATTVVDCTLVGGPVLERPGTVHVDALRYVVPHLDVSRMRRDTDGFALWSNRVGVLS